MNEPDTSQRRVLSPSSLNRLVRDLLGDALPQVWVEGELSNVARPSSGHVYFTLKDAKAQIRCAMFKPKSTWMKFRPEAGMQVLVRARVGLYETRGDYQLIVEHMEEAGAGALQREFEQLKARLQAEGLFDEDHKKPVPPFARRIGVITSATGAAIRDVLSVMARRFPLAQVEVLPVPVQGKQAPAAIVAMLRKANAAARHDVLLLTRGGGSLEDLWAFNDEAVARAIYASDIPVMSAVGHEVDFSISDFVADQRAPTPSAAAELLVPEGRDLLRGIERLRARLQQFIEQKLQARAQHLDHLQSRLQSGSPRQRLVHGSEHLQSLHTRLWQVSRHDLSRSHARLESLQVRLHTQHPHEHLLHLQRELEQWRRELMAHMRQRLQRCDDRVIRFGHALQTASPLATLQRGYAIVMDEQGRVLRVAAEVPAGTKLHIRLGDGGLHATTE